MSTILWEMVNPNKPERDRILDTLKSITRETRAQFPASVEVLRVRLRCLGCNDDVVLDRLVNG